MPVDRTLLRNAKNTDQSESEQMFRSFKALEALYHQYDLAQAELERAVGKPICIEACGKCCESTTPVVSRIEALYILSSASFLPTYQDLKKRSEQWLTDQQIEFHDNPAAFEQDFKLLQRVGCPYLAPDKTCMVYQFRPIACRSYGVVRPADPWCSRPLHYTESDSVRMLIGRETPLGQTIERTIRGIVGHVKGWRLELSQVGLLPSFIAKEVIPTEKLSAMPIAPAKRLRRDSTASPLFAEQWKRQIVRELEKSQGDIIDVTV